jgi:DUF1680 family protein
MAHVARLTHDDELKATSERLWKDIIARRMYITGQIGSTRIGESFTFDYDLPNDTMYGESCASVGMSFFSRRMMELEPNGAIGDVLEKELFNGALSGMSYDGRHFFYVNPLEADPQASQKDPGKKHILTRRAEWFDVPCCPANIARLVASVQDYIYTVGEMEGRPTVYSHQFIANSAEFSNGVAVSQENDFPRSGEIAYSIENPENKTMSFAVRIPKWSSRSFTVTVNGQAAQPKENNGFIVFDLGAGTTQIKVTLDMSVRVMAASARVKEDIGKVAVMRGPVVYCAESTDNKNGTALWQYRVDPEGDIKERFDGQLLGGLERISLPAVIDEVPVGDALYSEVDENPAPQSAELELIPYSSWANRDEGQMQVWLRRL